MWKFVSVFTSLWFMSLVIYAGKGDLEIQLVNNNKIELNPGSNSNMAIMLVNNTDSDKEFQLKITTPDGLSQLTDYSSVIVERASKKLKIFSFYVNESTGVGDYSIGIEAWDKLENSKIGEIQIPVYVKPQYAILTSVMKAPDYVFSGDTLSVQFMVQNLSNTKVNAEATIINAKISETKKLALNPGSSVFIRVFVTTEKDIIQYIRKSVSLSASIVENPETTSETSCIFDVIPSGKIKFDSYNRIPTKISGLFVTNNQTGERLYGYMFDITGAGTISYRKKREIAFHFRGPNRQGNPLFKPRFQDIFPACWHRQFLQFIEIDHNHRRNDPDHPVAAPGVPQVDSIKRRIHFRVKRILKDSLLPEPTESILIKKRFKSRGNKHIRQVRSCPCPFNHLRHPAGAGRSRLQFVTHRLPGIRLKILHLPVKGLQKRQPHRTGKRAGNMEGTLPWCFLPKGNIHLSHIVPDPFLQQLNKGLSVNSFSIQRGPQLQKPAGRFQDFPIGQLRKTVRNEQIMGLGVFFNDGKDTVIHLNQCHGHLLYKSTFPNIVISL